MLHEFFFVVTNKQLMVVDLQGVCCNLCDPEIASMVLLEEGQLNFCVWNLSADAIETFITHHKCNKF